MSEAELTTHIALLRGINVGGKNKLPMKDLINLFVHAGCHNVRTYIQSGNVVFRATSDAAEIMSNQISEAILKQFNYQIPVVLRTAQELRAVATSNPYLEVETDLTKLHVAFLADLPGAAELASLDPDRSPPDKFCVIGREIYSHCPNGVARSKLTNAYFDRRLGTTSTARNWRTVCKLVDMA